MIREMLDKDLLHKNIDTSKYFLIGLGEDVQVPLSEMESHPLFLAKRNELEALEDGDAYYPFLIRYFLQPEFCEKQVSFYKKLKEFCAGKNYFILSTVTDDLIYSVFSEEDHVVTPCGGYRKLQCSDSSHQEIVDFPKDFWENFCRWVEGKTPLSDIKLPTCPKCGKLLSFNQVSSENYMEDDYLTKWKLYTKWLEGTMNRDLMIMELGAGMMFPSVIRWPFEKLSFYNKKSCFYRVNETIPQLPDNKQEKAYSVDANPFEFVSEYLK